MNSDDHSACLTALSESLAEVAATVLGGLRVDTHAEQAGPAAPHGAYLALVAQGEPIQLGLLADPGGCQLLARTLLGMDPDDEELPTSDVSDAMCEIINIVAGGVKRRVSPGVGRHARFADLRGRPAAAKSAAEHQQSHDEPRRCASKSALAHASATTRADLQECNQVGA
jgi:hypothetical protein